MTPKFDNLARLLMEMSTPRIPDEVRQEIAEYITEFPEATYKEIAAAFDIDRKTVSKIGIELKVARGKNTFLARHGGHEKHPLRITSDAQEIQVLDYWMANHDDMTLPELAIWAKQQFGIEVSRGGVQRMLVRAAAKQVPPVQLPLPDKGKGKRLRKQRSQLRNEPGSGKLPTQGSHYFKDTEPGIVPSNPNHGGYAPPPRSPGE